VSAVVVAQQYDLFGEDEAKKAERARRREWNNSPHTCPSCGRTERNGHLLSNHHGYQFGQEGIGGWPLFQHPNYGAHCVAQSLVRNHIRFAVHTGRQALLADRSARGRELGLDVEAIIAEARAEMDS
jgi:hypothetical protein